MFQQKVFQIARKVQITARQRSCGKVMFLVMSVILFGGSPYVTNICDVLDFTVHGLPAAPTLDIRHGTPLDMGHSPVLPSPHKHQTWDPS